MPRGIPSRSLPHSPAGEPRGRGLVSPAWGLNNGGMSKQAPFKQSQVFGWDSEPVDERPSEFMSTGYSSLSGYHGLGDARRAERHTSSRFGLKSMLVFSIAVIGAGGYALTKLAPMLHHLLVS